MIKETLDLSGQVEQMARPVSMGLTVNQALLVLKDQRVNPALLGPLDRLARWERLEQLDPKAKGASKALRAKMDCQDLRERLDLPDLKVNKDSKVNKDQ